MNFLYFRGIDIFSENQETFGESTRFGELKIYFSTSDKNADFVELVGELICPSGCPDHAQSHDELMSRLLSEFKPEKNGQIEIISNGFIYQPKSVKEWTKRAYRPIDSNNQNELDSIQFKLQGN